MSTPVFKKPLTPVSEKTKLPVKPLTTGSKSNTIVTKKISPLTTSKVTTPVTPDSVPTEVTTLKPNTKDMPKTESKVEVKNPNTSDKKIISEPSVEEKLDEIMDDDISEDLDIDIDDNENFIKKSKQLDEKELIEILGKRSRVPVNYNETKKRQAAASTNKVVKKTTRTKNTELKKEQKQPKNVKIGVAMSKPKNFLDGSPALAAVHKNLQNMTKNEACKIIKMVSLVI